MLEKERAKKLTEILESNKEQKMYLFALTKEEALAKINSMGYDFTLEELNEYGSLLKSYIAEDGELDIDTLDSVAGGVDVGGRGNMTW